MRRQTVIKIPGIDLRDYQQPFWNYLIPEEQGQRAVIVWPRRNGKDLISINALAAKALQRRGDYAYIAPYSKQVRSIIWEGQTNDGKPFLSYIPPQIVKRKLDQSMKIWLTNGSTIQLFGSDNPDALVGTNFVGVIFTEFSLHRHQVWHFIRPMLLLNGGWAVFNGTPRGMNHFYDMAQMAQKNEHWFYQLLTCEDTGFPSKEQIEEERAAGMPESLIQQEYYCSWTASSEDTLIPLDNIQTCLSLSLQEEDYAYAPKIIGVDPAYAAKGDKAVIIRRQGRWVSPPDKYQGLDPMALASKVAFYLSEWKADLCFVDAGRGEAVWSRLHQLGFVNQVIPVDFGGASYDTFCYRKRDEMWNRMKQHICSAAPPSLPNDPDLIRDLSSPTFELTDRGLKLESKKHMKARGLPSTDCGDALALTYAEDFITTESATPTSDYKFEESIQYNPISYLTDLELTFERRKRSGIYTTV